MSTLIRKFLQINNKIVVYNVIKNSVKCQCSTFAHINNRSFYAPLLRNSFLPQSSTINARQKSKSKKVKEESGEEDETINAADDFEKELVDKNTKIIQSKVNSLRTDVLLKAGLGMPRSKVDEMFYESRIRVNGQKIYKKSETVREGDEVDIVKGADTNNPNFLTVARVEILAVLPKGEGFLVKLRRCKTLTIENYDEPWQS